MPGGRISNTKFSDLSDLIDLGALHNSPIGRSVSLYCTHSDTQGGGTSTKNVFAISRPRLLESKSRFGVGVLLESLTGPLELLYNRLIHVHVRAIVVVAATGLSELEAITGISPAGGLRLGTRLSLGRRSPTSR